MPLDPARTVRELEELRELTGDENGAQRVAWTETWEQARAWLREKVAPTGARYELDQAGNQWFTIPGRSEKALLIGGHMDSVPNGGWLDGCLNVLAGVEVLRRIAEEGEPPVTVRLVDWADEEGARFGRSLFGSSAASGSMQDQVDLAKLTDRDGVTLLDVLQERGIDLKLAGLARRQLQNAAAYLELHIEQGPVLESLDLPLGVVLGTFGVERCRITWRGQAAHAGSTPMDRRRDALAGAAKLALAIREIAAEVGERRRLHVGRRRLQARHRHLRRRDGRAAARPAPPRRGQARTAARSGRRGVGGLRGRGEPGGRPGSGSGRSHRSSSTSADRARRRGGSGGRGYVASPAVAARCTTRRRSHGRASRR